MTRLSMVAPLVTLLTLTTLAHEADAGARRKQTRPNWPDHVLGTRAGTVIDCAGNTGTGRRAALREPLVSHRQRRRDDPRQANRADVGEAVRRRLDSRPGQRLHLGRGVREDHDLTRPLFAGFCDWRLPNRFELEYPRPGDHGPGGLCGVQHGLLAGLHVLTGSCTIVGRLVLVVPPDGPVLAWNVNFLFGSVNRADNDTTSRPAES